MMSSTPEDIEDDTIVDNGTSTINHAATSANVLPITNITDRRQQFKLTHYTDSNNTTTGHIKNNFFITNYDTMKVIQNKHTHDSWQVKILHILHNRKVQLFLMLLLCIDIVVLFTDLWLLAEYPNCSIIQRDGINCCPISHASTNSTTSEEIVVHNDDNNTDHERHYMYRSLLQVSKSDESSESESSSSISVSVSVSISSTDKELQLDSGNTGGTTKDWMYRYLSTSEEESVSTNTNTSSEEQHSTDDVEHENTNKEEHGQVCSASNTSPNINTKVGCNEHKYYYVHVLESIFFYITIIVLVIFLIENTIEIIVLTPCVYFTQIYFIIDFFIIIISLVLELVFHLSSKQTLQSIIGILIIGRIWRFVRISHGIIEITSELSSIKYHTLITYTEQLHDLLKQHNIPLPSSEHDKLLQQQIQNISVTNLLPTTVKTEKDGKVNDNHGKDSVVQQQKDKQEQVIKDEEQVQVQQQQKDDVDDNNIADIEANTNGNVATSTVSGSGTGTVNGTTITGDINTTTTTTTPNSLYFE